MGGQNIIEIPAEPANEDDLPPLLKGFKAVPPLVTDIDLSMDDKFLYVACWGTGDLQRYDVSDPFNPNLTGKVRIGGIVSKGHPSGSGGGMAVHIACNDIGVRSFILSGAPNSRHLSC